MKVTFATTVKECVGTFANYSVEDLKMHGQLELADLWVLYARWSTRQKL